MIVLGIESSCDETAAAIVSDKREILGESLLSQEEHKAFGGVVPEIAARSHLEHIDEIIELCVKRAGIAYHALMKGSPVSCEEGTLFLSGCPADTVLQVFGPGFGQGSTDLISGGMHHAVSSIGPDGPVGRRDRHGLRGILRPPL